MAINITGDVTTDASGGFNGVGVTGTGAMTIDGGSTLLVDANVANRDMEFQVGQNLSANGTLNVTGTGSKLHFIGINAPADPEFRVGDDGSASVSFTNGAELLMEDNTSSGTDRADFFAGDGLLGGGNTNFQTTTVLFDNASYDATASITAGVFGRGSGDTNATFQNGATANLTGYEVAGWIIGGQENTTVDILSGSTVTIRTIANPGGQLQSLNAASIAIGASEDLQGFTPNSAVMTVDDSSLILEATELSGVRVGTKSGSGELRIENGSLWQMSGPSVQVVAGYADGSEGIIKVKDSTVNFDANFVDIFLGLDNDISATGASGSQNGLSSDSGLFELDNSTMTVTSTGVTQIKLAAFEFAELPEGLSSSGTLRLLNGSTMTLGGDQFGARIEIGAANLGTGTVEVIGGSQLILDNGFQDLSGGDVIEIGSEIAHTGSLLIDGNGSSVQAVQVDVGNLSQTFGTPNVLSQSGTLTLTNGGSITTTGRMNVGKDGTINFDGGTLNGRDNAGEIAFLLRQATVNVTEAALNQVNSNVIIADGTVFNFKAADAGVSGLDVGRLDMDGDTLSLNNINSPDEITPLWRVDASESGHQFTVGESFTLSVTNFAERDTTNMPVGLDFEVTGQSASYANAMRVTKEHAPDTFFGGTYTYDFLSMSNADGSSRMALDAAVNTFPGATAAVVVNVESDTGKGVVEVGEIGILSSTADKALAYVTNNVTTFQGKDTDDTMTATGTGIGFTFEGRGGADTLTGGGGADMLMGGDGGDMLDGGDGLDTASYADSVGAVNVDLAADTASGGYAAGDSLDSIENLIGSDGDDTLTGDGNTNYLDGGAGADDLTGGANNDVYVVDNVGDTVTELAGEGDDIVDSFITLTIPVNVEVLRLQGTADIDGTGSTGADIIQGNAGENIINGDAGIDVMIGGAGNDVYAVDNSFDAVIEAAGGGFDNVYSSVDYLLNSEQEIESAILTGNAVTLRGDDSDNQLFGNDNVNVLEGKLGTDYLLGLGGDDIFQVSLEANSTDLDVFGDFEGAGVAGGDRIAFDAAIWGTDGIVTQVSQTSFQVSAADGSNAQQFIIANLAAGNSGLLEGDDYYFG